MECLTSNKGGKNWPSKITFMEYNEAILSRGILSGGFCPGGFVWGDFVLEPSDSPATAIGDLL